MNPRVKRISVDGKNQQQTYYRQTILPLGLRAQTNREKRIHHHQFSRSSPQASFFPTHTIRWHNRRKEGAGNLKTKKETDGNPKHIIHAAPHDKYSFLVQSRDILAVGRRLRTPYGPTTPIGISLCYCCVLPFTVFLVLTLLSYSFSKLIF